MASSETVRMPSARVLITSNGMSPGRPTMMPSAIVAKCSSETGRPAASDGG
jgi:hypothetical protein